MMYLRRIKSRQVENHWVFCLTDPDISQVATLALYGAFDYTLPAALNGPQFISRSVLKNR